MTNREKYNKELSVKIAKIASDKKEVISYSKRISKKHNIPNEQVIDLLNQRIQVAAVDDKVAFAIGEVFDINLEKYFTSSEIKNLSKWKQEKVKFKFPLEFNMKQVSEDQWIGSTSVSELMKLRDSQIINYNENTQRIMKRVEKGNEEFYSIHLNIKAIKSIEQLYLNGTFIPNTITLNMPEDSIFKYDQSSETLTIRKMNHFDITDGYHRYIAMSNCYNLDSSFDYPMILCITNYSEDKCRQMIWQEDQKTKMAKVDSNSLNLQSSANKVVQKLNTDSTFYLIGSINTSGGCINKSELAEIIRATYFQRTNITSKQKEIQDIIKAEQDLRNGINHLVENHTELLNKTWNRFFLYALVYNIYVGESYISLYDETIRMEKLAISKKMFATREIKQIDMKRLAAIKRGENKDV